MALPLIPILAGVGILGAGAGVGAGIAGMTAGTRTENISYAPYENVQTTYSPQSTYAPITTTTTTTSDSRIYAPQYSYLQQITIDSPNAQTIAKKEQSVSPTSSTSPQVQAMPYIMPTIQPVLSSAPTTSTGGGDGGLFSGIPFGSIILLAGLGLGGYFLYKKVL